MSHHCGSASTHRELIFSLFLAVITLVIVIETWEFYRFNLSTKDFGKIRPFLVCIAIGHFQSSFLKFRN